MLGVGSKVKLVYDMEGPTGTIISMSYLGQATVRFTTPNLYVVTVDLDMLCEADDSSIVEHKTGNPTIDNAVDNGMSIEQQIEWCGEGWLGGVFPINEPFEIKSPYSKSSISDFLLDITTDNDDAHLTPSWEKALHKVFIDMALDTGDFEWLAELSNQYK